MAASTYLAQVQQLYIAYFGRPADPVGQNYWATQIDAANGSIASVIAGFSASTESAALFGNKSSIDKVTAIYQNAFGRAPEPAGLAYWVAQLDSGKVSQAQASWTIQQSAGPGDAAAVQNKLTAAQAFTAQIDTTAEIQGYQGAAAAASARAFLATVTQDNATATAAVNGAAAAVVAATAVGVVGTTFTLTTSLDNLTGDNGNNTFIGDAATVSAADQINGGAGTDTLNIFGATAAQVLPTMNSVERLVLTNQAAALTDLNVTGVAGLTDVVLQNAKTGNMITTAAGTTVTFDGATTVAQQVVTAATATAATVGLTNGASVGTLTVDGAAVKTLNIASNGSAANTIGTLIGTAGLTTQANSTLNITGTQKLTVTTALDADFTTVNASTNTGGVSVAFNANDVTVTGGAGNDSFNFGTNLTAADKVDGGAGIDTVSVADLSATTLAGLNAVKNVETVAFTGAAALTVALGSAVGSLSNTAITKLVFNTADAGIDVVNAADAAHTYAFGSANTGAATLNLATGVTTVNVALEGGATAGVVGALTVTPLASDLVATPTLVNTVNIASSGVAGVAANTIASVAAQAGSTIKVTGAKDLTIGGLTNKATVDASAFTGNLVITGSTGADKFILGAGADKVNTASTYAATDTITNFTKADTLVLTGSTVAAAADLVKYDASTSLSLEAALVAADAATATGKASYFVFGSDTYVVSNIDAASVTATGSTDVVVKLAGQLTLAADASGIHAAA
jgi:hypothetical protein